MYKLIKKSSFRLASNLALILVLLITGCNLPGNSESSHPASCRTNRSHIAPFHPDAG